MAIEIVDLPITNGGSFHAYVSLPEGKNGSSTFLGGTVSHCMIIFIYP